VGRGRGGVGRHPSVALERDNERCKLSTQEAHENQWQKRVKARKGRERGV